MREPRVPDDPVADKPCARPAPRRPQQQHHQQRSPRTPELHRSPQKRNCRSAAPPARAGRAADHLNVGRSADRRRWLGAPLAREDSARVSPTRLNTADLSAPCFGEHPIAEPRGAAGGRSSNIIIIDVAVWRRVSCWSHAAARWPVVASARRRSAAPPASPDCHQQTIDVGRPLPHRAPHRRLAQFAHPAGRSRMPIALHGLALRKASDAISPLNAVVEPGCCRTPPAAATSVRRERPSSSVQTKTKWRRRPAAAPRRPRRQRVALRRVGDVATLKQLRARARGFGASKPNAAVITAIAKHLGGPAIF